MGLIIINRLGNFFTFQAVISRSAARTSALLAPSNRRKNFPPCSSGPGITPTKK
jgi:hypothetical protein